MVFLLVLLPFMLQSAEFEVEIQNNKLSSSRQELAEIIVDSFIKKPDMSFRNILHPRVETILQSESEEFCTILSKHAFFNHDLSPVVADDQVSERVLQIFTEAVEIVVKEKEEEIIEKNSRCKRSTVIILTTILSLGTAAATAAITAAVTLAINE